MWRRSEPRRCRARPRALASPVPYELRALGRLADQSVLAFDRRQGNVRMSFERYASTRVTSGRIQRARQLMQRHAALARIQRQFGVPGNVVVAIWGSKPFRKRRYGRLPVIRTLATMAHRCRRPTIFRAARRVEGGAAISLARSDGLSGKWARRRFPRPRCRIPASITTAIEHINTAQRQDVLASTTGESPEDQRLARRRAPVEGSQIQT